MKSKLVKIVTTKAKGIWDIFYPVFAVTIVQVQGISRISAIETQELHKIGQVFESKNAETGSKTYHFVAQWNGWRGKEYETLEHSANVCAQYLRWQLVNAKYGIDSYRKFVHDQNGHKKERKVKTVVVTESEPVKVEPEKVTIVPASTASAELQA